jgi:hypothetical protein
MQAWTTNAGPISGIGSYSFSQLLPGVYWVNETELANWVPTSPSVTKITIPAYPPAMVVVTVNFGNMHPSDPQLNFVLKKGVNIWSSPLYMSTTMHASDLARMIGSKCSMIKRYDPATKMYYTYKPGVSGPGQDFEILAGVGYFVVTTGSTTFTLEGEFDSAKPIAVSGGANLIGVTTLKPLMASQFVNQDPSKGPVYVFGAKVQLIKYLGVDGMYHTYKPSVSGPSQDFVLTQGNAYFLQLDGPGSIVYPAC